MVSNKDNLKHPVIGITMGDPLGIGPEVVVRALQQADTLGEARFLIYGSNELLNLAADRIGFKPNWSRIPHDSSRRDQKIDDRVVVLDYEQPEILRREEAGPSPVGGRLSYDFVEHAIADALLPADSTRHLDAIVTAPISKQAWSMVGSRFPGHTELIAHRTRAKRHTMLFRSKKLTVALATAHVPLMDLRNTLTIGKVFDPIDVGHRFLTDLGIESPRIAVCGLNPHAGENGLLGDEDLRLIAPAIDMARNTGIDVHGPFPADTLFISAARGEWDLVVAMYHDQGLIPVKLLGWQDAVNVTVGTPLIRTSPDHGTAYDIARRYKADPSSMIHAVQLACKLATRRLLTNQDA
ncbi:MAG: 4-hydroxythreonine-4-phosphate dehydrogenase PdxA [Planctomycetes bacterium TMED75]|nr:4-hydroxythreonine-4-phosphate dehydrogenase PdxA [Planctomycetaceae bacterium]OUU92323.1 MAG: 4-hydroxythreonine-4-phosphate dehydrogenase PdxA [Planctomycetes bacterium TMED75]